MRHLLNERGLKKEIISVWGFNRFDTGLSTKGMSLFTAADNHDSIRDLRILVRQVKGVEVPKSSLT